MCAERLSLVQFGRLERELARGPLAHGWTDESRGWTLRRARTLTGRTFRGGYTVQGVWKLMRRHGWSAQVLVRRALERDDGAAGVRKEAVWPQMKVPRPAWAHTSVPRTRPGRA